MLQLPALPVLSILLYCPIFFSYTMQISATVPTPTAGFDASTPAVPIAGAGEPPNNQAAALNMDVTDALSPHSAALVADSVAQDAAAQQRIMLHMPVSIRSVSLVVLAVFAGIFVLHWAKAVFVPVMLALLFSYALSPMVNWLESRHVPRWLSAGLILAGIFIAIALATYSLRHEAAELIEEMPVAIQKFRQAIKTSSSGGGPSALESMQKAAEQLEQAAQESAVDTANPNVPAAPGNTTVNKTPGGTVVTTTTVNGSSSVVTTPPRGTVRVVVDSAPRFNIQSYLWTGTLGLATAVAQSMVVLFLTYFLMISGDAFRRKLLKLAGPSLSSKKITLQALNEITLQIQRYLQVQVLISALVGVLTWLALAALGLSNAAVWGIAAGVLNLIPYVGGLVTAVGSALVAFLQFGSINMAVAVGGVSVFIHTIVGNLLAPWLTSRTSQLNPVSVFIGLLAWGWLWGVWGLLLGIPILMMVKAVCDRVDELKPVGELLGG